MFASLMNKLFYGERGASMVEYALLVVLIAIVGLLAVAFFGENLADTYGDIASELETAGT